MILYGCGTRRRLIGGAASLVLEEDSSDSRYWGPLPNEYIVGKAVFVYWPISAFGVMETTNIIGGE